MLNVDQIITEWNKYPTGKIGKGEFCEHCARFNARNMTSSTIAIKDNKVLLIKRKREPAAGFWALPGGYVDWDETLDQTATREFKEETGMEVSEIKFLTVYDDLNRDKDGRQNVDHCFVGTVADNQVPNLDPNEVLEMDWFTFNNLPDNIAFDHRDMINDYLAKHQELITKD